MLTIIVVWQGVPFVAFTTYAALGQVPGEVLEAASLDGATGIKRFRFVVFPYLRSVLLVVLVLQIIWNLRIFTQVYALQSRGGLASETNVLGTYMFRQGPGDFGFTSAIGVVMVVLLLVPVVAVRSLDTEGGGAVSTQINAGTQLGTIGVDEILDDGGRPKAPQRRSIEARRPSSKRVATRTLLNVAALIVFVCSVFPVYWMVNMSLTPSNKIISRSPSMLPLEFTFKNYVTAWTREAAPGQTDFPHGLMTSIIVTSGVLIATLLFAFLASVAVARFRFRGRRLFIVSVLIIQMIPGEAMMFTIYGMIDDWRLMNTMLGLGIVYLASVIPFTIWTLRGFVAGVPADLEEAAMIDGCTKSQAFWRVTFPLLAPGLVATGIFAFIQAWNEFTMALLLMKGYNLTLPTWLNSFQSATEATNWGAVMAGATLISIPVVIFFLIVQGRMTGGLVAGAVKG